VEAVGRLEPDHEVVLSAEIPGIVGNYTVDLGDRVEKNQVLVRLEQIDYKLALNEANANLDAAKARFDAAQKTFNRSENLLLRKVISAESYEKAEAEYKSSKATVSQMQALLNIAEQRFNKTEIKTPFQGFVTGRMVELGQNVGIGESVMSVAAMEIMRVKIHLKESDYIHLDRDDPVEIKIEAFPEKRFSGRVGRVGIKADPRTNTFDVEILVKNPDTILKAGLTARVFITTDVIHNAIMISQSCVLHRETQKEVFIINNEQKALARTVKLGQVEGSFVRILEGLVPGDKLVVSGSQYLKTGDKVILSE
jgi:RND family efflux transporter MFP subunit